MAVTIDGEAEPAADVPNEDGLILEPLNAEHAAATRAKKPMRGRPRGSTRKSKVDVKLFSQQLVGAHKLVAVLTQQPIIEIETAEGDQLAKSIGDIIEEYGFSASRRAILWGNLAAVVGIVYGPKFLLIRESIKANRNKSVTIKPQPQGNQGNAFKMDFSNVA